MAKFTDATGRRLMRSTKQKDRKIAAQIAEKWEAAARKARRGELTQAASVKILRDMMEAITGDKLRAPTIAETVNDYLATRATLGRASSTATRYKPIVASFLKSIGEVRATLSYDADSPSRPRIPPLPIAKAENFFGRCMRISPFVSLSTFRRERE